MAKVDENEDESWNLKFREDEEMEFFTELALHETERWIQAVTKKKFAYPDDFRKSLENGVLLCELLNGLKPGAVKRINKLPGAIAGLDNINVFLKACRASFGLNDKHLFDPGDLEDLSQRAIADSEHLKQEEDRRAVNVAITVYWLGRSVASSNSGPQLDTSAFSALVHHGKDLISDEHFRHDSWESHDYSSAYSSHESNSKVSLPDESFEQKHTRDSSYESYGSYSRGSESLDEENMPVRRYGSASSLNRSGEQLRFSATSDIYSDGQDSLYQSSPDLLHGTNNHHRRSSSTDSMDGSYHSRQSSDSVENYPTRTRSTQRKTSTSTADPLQFIKLRPSNDLAKKAAEQIKAVEAVKTERVKVEKELEADLPDDNWQSTQPSDVTGGDWQSNLSSWKNRRRRQSAATYERVEGSVDGAAEKQKEDEEKKKPKTYGQIMAERDKRKSTGSLHFYPIEDDDEPSWLASVKSSGKSEPEPVSEPVVMRRTHRTEERSPTSASSWRTRSTGSLKERTSSVGSDKYINYDDTNVAPWAEEESGDEADKNKKKNDKTETQETVFKSERTRVTENNNVNVRYSDKSEKYSSWRSRQDNSPVDKKFTSSQNKTNSEKSTSKISGLLKSFEQKDEDAKVSYDKPKKSFQFSASESSRRAEGFRNQKSKSFDSSTMGLTFSASPVKTEKVKSPVHVNPALLKKDASPKHEVTSPKNFIEKSIKISQKPRNDRGFGFTISGGADKKEPIEVSKVNLGSAADVCELNVHDEIVSINRRDITSLTQLQVQRLIDKGVEKGEIELQIKRKISDEDIWDEEDDDDDDAFHLNSSNQTNPKTSSASRSYSPLQSQHRSFSPVQQQQHRSFSPIHRSKSPLQSQHRSASPVNSPRRSFSPVQNQHQNISPVERQRKGISSPVQKTESSSPKIETSTPLQAEETRERRKSPLTFDANFSPSRFEQSNKFKVDSDADKNRSEGELGDDKMWIMDKLVNSSQPLSNDFRQNYEQEETAAELEPRQDEQIITEPQRIEVAFSHHVEPPTRQEVVEETEVIQKSVQSNQFSQLPSEPPVVSALPETSPKVDIEVVERPTVVMRRKKPAEQKPQENELIKWDTAPSNNPPSQPTSADDSGGFGPPAALRRWQRPRPRSDYNFATNSVLDNSDDFKKRLSGNWQLDKPSVSVRYTLDRASHDFEATVSSLKLCFDSKIIGFNKKRDEKRMRAWDRKQARARQIEPENSSSSDRFSEGQQQFEMETKRLQQQYENDRKRTEISGQQEQNSGNVIQGTVGEPVTLQISANSRDLHAAMEPIRINVSSQQQSELRIDPRNRSENSEQNLPQYNFHLNLGQSDKKTADSNRDDLELERQRIREEEKRQLEEERKRWEEEEKRRIQEKEQQLREQEENLRLEKERLRQQQEEMERQKNELERARMETNSPRFEQTTNRDYSRTTFNSRPQISTSANIDSKVGPRRLDTSWPPNDQAARTEKEKQKLTREDLLAMNRKATPLQKKPENEQVDSNADNTTDREVPTRHHDLHSLNVVPKSRIRNSVDWINSNDSSVVRRSDPNPHEHWLVEEAERRRLADNKGRPGRHSVHAPFSNFSGPIKPTSEGLSNKWRDDSNVPRQHTFDSSSGGLTKPRSLHNSSQNETRQFSAKQQANVSMSQTLPSNFSYDNLNVKKEPPPPVAPKPMRSSPNPPSPASPSSPANHAEQFMAVSGKQGCSHCGQELGFGAAMVIESLGLYYHVQCFRCCVCHTVLGNGSEGADVRVRVNKLHCRNCYSNDEAGLKFSKV